MLHYDTETYQQRWWGTILVGKWQWPEVVPQMHRYTNTQIHKYKGIIAQRQKYEGKQ